jgi:hypothetical protein
VPFGHALDPAVLTNLRSASLVLFVVTTASVASPACQREMGAAQVLRIPTVPLMHLLLIAAVDTAHTQPKASERVAHPSYRPDPVPQAGF